MRYKKIFCEKSLQAVSLFLLIVASCSVYAASNEDRERQSSIAPPSSLSVTDVAARTATTKAAINSAVVVIETPLGRSGTGFIIGDGRWIVTNYHVVKDEPNLEVGFSSPQGGVQIYQAKLWTTDVLNDLALLRLDYPLPVEPLRLALYIPEQPSDVFALGYPGAVETVRVRDRNEVQVSWSKGNVTRVLTDARRRQPIEHTARISQGYSGGPLLNECLHVVGMNTAIAREDQTSGFVVSLATLANEIVLFARLGGAPVEIEREPCKSGIGAPLDEAAELAKWRSALIERFERCSSRLKERPEVCRRIFDRFPGKPASLGDRPYFISIFAQLKRAQRKSASAQRLFEGCMSRNSCFGREICVDIVLRAMRGKPSQNHISAMKTAGSPDLARCGICASRSGIYDFGLRYYSTNTIDDQMRRGRCMAKTIAVTIEPACELRFVIEEGASRTTWNGALNPFTNETFAVLSEMKTGGADTVVEPLTKFSFGRFLKILEIDNPPCGPGNLQLLTPHAHLNLKSE
ncbi:MAG: serine protease [Hyphomicrobiales bacterium]|nr:serine protease [Hyphomicrobiales bacterium]